MAFDNDNFGMPSSASVGNLPVAPWTYWSSTDTLATIVASGYFNDLADKLHKDDLMWVVGSDDAELIKVTSAISVTPVTVAQVTGAASNIPLANGDYFVGNASNIATPVTMSGHITQTNAGVTSITNDVVTNAHVNSSAAIALNKLAATTASRALVSDGSGFVSPATTTSTEIGYVNGVTSAIQTQLDGKASSTLTSANIYVGNGSNVATGVAVTGDITLSNAGVSAVASVDLETATVTNIADTEVMIGTGAGTANFAALSQDATMANTGAVTVVSAQGNFESGAAGSGNVVFSGITASTGAGAVPVTGSIHEITTTGTGDALTLANGTAGQKLTLLYVAEGAGGDTAVLTPTTLAGGTTITFNTLGDSADLTYSSTGGWYMHGGTAVIA